MASVPQGSMTVGINGADFSDIAGLAANTYLRNDGGRFCTINSSGNLVLADSSSIVLDAWAFDCFQVIRDGNQGSTPYPTTATYLAGAFVATFTRDIRNERFAFWLPVYTGETIATSNLQLKCDLATIGATTATTQYVRPSVTTNKIVQILQIDINNNFALVKAL